MEAPNVENGTGRGPVSNGCSFDRIYSHSGRRDDEPQERDRFVQEGAFGGVGVKLLLLKLSVDRPEVLLMLGDGMTIDENVIKIYDQKLTGEGSKHIIHEAHECTQGIRESERHDEPFVEPFEIFKRRLPFIPCPDADLVIPVSEVQLGENFGAGQLVQQVINARDGKTIPHRYTVDGSAVNTQTPGTVLLGS